MGVEEVRVDVKALREAAAAVALVRALGHPAPVAVRLPPIAVKFADPPNGTW